MRAEHLSSPPVPYSLNAMYKDWSDDRVSFFSLEFSVGSVNGLSGECVHPCLCSFYFFSSLVGTQGGPPVQSRSFFNKPPPLHLWRVWLTGEACSISTPIWQAVIMVRGKGTRIVHEQIVHEQTKPPEACRAKRKAASRGFSQLWHLARARNILAD